MSQKNIIGRQYEIECLQEVLESKESELVVIYGRRRVGKTFLVNEFFDNQFDFKLTGVFNESSKVQLKRFSAVLEEYSGLHSDEPENWFKAFDALRAYLKALQKKRKVVFIDEMPWLDTTKSDFVTALESFWNGWAAAQGNIVLIACGSATSWMTNKLLGDRGGLFNRSSTRLFMRPFTLYETELYLKEKGIDWTRYDIAECYMIMGGIPFYLKQLNAKWSYTQNIDNMFFRDKAVLWDEFDHLYHSLFKQADAHIAVVEALAKKKMGLTRSEIINETRLPANGKIGTILKNLEINGFVRPYRFFGKKKQETIYQLCDFYSMFYFTYIKDNYGKDAHFWTNSLDNPSRLAWAGYTFEQLCKEHLDCIKKKLGIAGVLTETSSWFSKGEDEKENGATKRGAQIDLLIDRRDRVINLCEIKFSLNDYTIDADYDKSLRNKIETFKHKTGTRKSIQLTMITTYGINKNKYSNRVQSEVVLDDFFVPT
jgi:AAA+ ATPase superfamily predicted ATPase